ncbi:hypothetical protein [Paragemmobacter straminiformis]|uniref:DUF2946 domain-containing protein n=1 Tax=Paragemmobacter straminiformis TaxID=2045119 RepID=A0A842I1I0_9RHOB|nr:hypothetical protein [Gemmobacter straminiformis]MBC2834252.1 hypothetical protein [Gemmobacter straminiformis]
MLRAFVSLFLAVLLSLTSVTAAVARSQMAGATELVVCAGSGTAEITLDATGAPISRPHHCPVCTAASAGIVAGVAPQVQRPVTRSEPQVCAMPLPDAGAGAPVPSARGPPVSL